MIAFGNGSMTALFYTILINDTNEGLRSILLFNGITYIDKVMRESLTMCVESDFYWQNLTRSTRTANMIRRKRQSQFNANASKQDKTTSLMGTIESGDLKTLDDPHASPFNPLKVS